ncbi:DsbA family oxidoreductase [Vibrio sp. JC009]|uniref:DsbA family oxidoreductase n=1 Tax=Vibrio sp. JC009 TaxID=2912314 RepID=UPI0023AF1B35|nr:DsbA family oxidoreductase [Vibrio sp. JC009]WED24791.1 DsbA family oxidoreductase [Vibrio sp. JC009]
MKTVRIDLISDVVCPWCIIGYKRLEKAMEMVADQLSVEVYWHHFELNPDMGPEGQNLREHVQQKYGSTAEQSASARQTLTELGKELGFEFNFTDESRIYNTRKAHQILLWSEESGNKHALEMKLFEAHFSQGKDISDSQVLAEIALSVGLDGDSALEVINSPQWSEKVFEAEMSWISVGVQAVPSFVVNERHLISGAQEPQVLADALLDIASEE